MTAAAVNAWIAGTFVDTWVLGQGAPGLNGFYIKNNQGAGVVICQPVYIDAANSFKLAKADAAGTSNVAGLVGATTLADQAIGLVQCGGLFTATDAQWKAINGGVSLVPGTWYFLDAATAGNITATAPAVPVPIGLAINTTVMELP